MILTMTLMFEMEHGRYSILASGDWQCWIMEREWKWNRPNISSVPRDEYTLEPHSSPKYPNTWALIGDGVGHYADEGKPRFACVIHKAQFPTDLEGCFAPCYSIGAHGNAVDYVHATEDLMSLLEGDPEDTHMILMQ